MLIFLDLTIQNENSDKNFSYLLLKCFTKSEKIIINVLYMGSVCSHTSHWQLQWHSNRILKSLLREIFKIRQNSDKKVYKIIIWEASVPNHLTDNYSDIQIAFWKVFSGNFSKYDKIQIKKFLKLLLMLPKCWRKFCPHTRLAALTSHLGKISANIWAKYDKKLYNFLIKKRKYDKKL